MFKINETRPRRAGRKINFYSARCKPGFSIVEIMTVLFVVSIGMVGVLSLIIQNIQSQSVNKGALIAYQLAQEGIELVRYTRDSNWAASRDWNYYLTTPGTNYIMDYNDFYPRVISCTGQSGLKKNNAGYYYNPGCSGDQNPDSGFTRIISLGPNPEDLNNAKTMHVQSTVTWKDHNRNFSYVLDTNLYDWK